MGNKITTLKYLMGFLAFEVVICKKERGKLIKTYSP
jgi:hypothetical protein